MKHDEDPRVVDLRRYRKAARSKRPAAAPPKPPAGEPVLGVRPRAGLILLAVVAVLLVLWVVPRFL